MPPCHGGGHGFEPRLCRMSSDFKSWLGEVKRLLEINGIQTLLQDELLLILYSEGMPPPVFVSQYKQLLKILGLPFSMVDKIPYDKRLKYKPGTPVRKAITRLGDMVSNGQTGVVKGSVVLMEEKNAYIVLWDGKKYLNIVSEDAVKKI